MGSTRCHDPTEELCLTPVMGSGPDPENSGTGFFTVQVSGPLFLPHCDRVVVVGVVVVVGGGGGVIVALSR